MYTGGSPSARGGRLNVSPQPRVKYTDASGRVNASSAVRIVVFPAPGGSAARMIEAPRSIPSHSSAVTRGVIVPARMISVIDIASGWL